VISCYVCAPDAQFGHGPDAEDLITAQNMQLCAGLSYLVNLEDNKANPQGMTSTSQRRVRRQCYPERTTVGTGPSKHLREDAGRRIPGRRSAPFALPMDLLDRQDQA
jgi:hypothetical protein